MKKSRLERLKKHSFICKIMSRLKGTSFLLKLQRIEFLLSSIEAQRAKLLNEYNELVFENLDLFDQIDKMQYPALFKKKS